MPERQPEYIQLTANELRYLEQSKQYPQRSEYIRGLLNGTHEYKVVAEYGNNQKDKALSRQLLESGLVPEAEQRAHHIVILKRTS